MLLAAPKFNDLEENHNMVLELYVRVSSMLSCLSSDHETWKCMLRDVMQDCDSFSVKRMAFLLSLTVTTNVLKTHVWKCLSLANLPWSWKETVMEIMKETHETRFGVIPQQQCQLHIVCDCALCIRQDQTFDADDLSNMEQNVPRRETMCAVLTTCDQYNALSKRGRAIFCRWFEFWTEVGNVRRPEKCQCVVCWVSDNTRKPISSLLQYIFNMPTFTYLPFCNKTCNAFFEQAFKELECKLTAQALTCREPQGANFELDDQQSYIHRVYVKISHIVGDVQYFSTSHAASPPSVPILRKLLHDTVLQSSELFSCLVQILHEVCVVDDFYVDKMRHTLSTVLLQELRDAYKELRVLLKTQHEQDVIYSRSFIPILLQYIPMSVLVDHGLFRDTAVCMTWCFRINGLHYSPASAPMSR